MHVEVKLFTQRLDVFQSLLIIGTSAADPDSDTMLDEGTGNLAKCTNDTFKGRSNLRSQMGGGQRRRNLRW